MTKPLAKQSTGSLRKVSEDEAANVRRDRRVPISIRALCYSRSRFSTVQIVNISNGGAALKGVGSLMANDPVEIVLLDNRKLTGKVRWWLMGACGVQFDTRLDEGDALLVGKLDGARIRYPNPNDKSAASAQ